MTPKQKIKLVVYYKNRETFDLVIKNNPCTNVADLKKSSIVYEYKCPLGDYMPQSKYFCMTETTFGASAEATEVWTSYI